MGNEVETPAAEAMPTLVPFASLVGPRLRRRF